MITPFSHLIKKGEKFIWDDKCQKALDNIKRYLMNPLVLAYYDYKRGILLHILATMHALGAMLT